VSIPEDCVRLVATALERFGTVNGLVKGALATLTKNVANAFASKRIRCNGILTGWMDTPGENLTQQKFHGVGEDWLAKAEAAQPMGQLVKPDQLAGLVTYLLSAESGVMTGASIDYDQRVAGAYPGVAERLETLPMQGCAIRNVAQSAKTVGRLALQFGHLKRVTPGDFCPEGGYRTLPGEWLLSRRDRLIVAWHEVPVSLDICRTSRREVFCPKGARGLSPGFQPGFNPGNCHPERRALKGRQIERTNNVES
jgi:hypothetical protein